MSGLRRWPRAALIPLLTLVALPACSQRQERKEAKPDMLSNLHCFGRFQVRLPGELQLAGRSQRIYGVSVTAEPIESGAVATAWSERLRTLGAHERSFELEPGVPAAWFRTTQKPAKVELHAGRTAADHIVLLRVKASPGRESAAETLVRNIVRTYAPKVSGSGFCVGYGSFGIEPARDEGAEIRFLNRSRPGFEVQIQTRTVEQPDTDSYSNLDEERGFAASSGAGLTIIREQERTVAGLAGKEIAISVAPPGEPALLRYTWHFDGVRHDATRPAINVMATARLPQRQQLDAIWQTILDSLVQVPLQVR